MIKKKVLFLIHDLGHGGAEKVLVNLVNNMNSQEFDITVITLFGGGVNEQFIKPHIRLKTIFKHILPGNSHIMKLFSPVVLHKLFIKEEYDIEIAYLEGPTARIISGCQNKKTKLATWIHCTMKTEQDVAVGFRNYKEAQICYSKMDNMVFVSEASKEDFLSVCEYRQTATVLYNTNETEMILKQSKEKVDMPRGVFCWCGVGKIVPIKGFDRMIRIQKRLVEEGYPAHLFILGEGRLKEDLIKMAESYGINESVTFLGYQTNPYKYMANCDLFVCASHSEGFSTATTEALIVGTPVCTVDVSGMKEMLGWNDEYGIVTKNDEESLYLGIKELINNKSKIEYYKKQAIERGKNFSSKTTVEKVENFIAKVICGEK